MRVKFNTFGLFYCGFVSIGIFIWQKLYDSKIKSSKLMIFISNILNRIIINTNEKKLNILSKSKNIEITYISQIIIMIILIGLCYFYICRKNKKKL